MRRRGKPLEISTFPFLAVLLCAMGSLILVLIVMDRKAKLAARYKATAAQAQAAEESARADAARRELLKQHEAEAHAAWETKREHLHTTLVNEEQALQIQIKKNQDQLADAAAKLKAELDDSAGLHKRAESEQTRLATEAQSAAATRQALEKDEAATAADRAAKEKMTADLVQLETAVKNLKEARERDKQTYSVVPYRGKHGESRRPLYIECARDAVVFHPEKVEVAVATNPIAARTEVQRRIARQREHLTSIQAKADDKPYLMLLVRPDGITTYYELQSAVRGLDLEFGYEFVDAAWAFDFSKEDAGPTGAPIAPSPPAPKDGTPVVGVGGQQPGPAIAMLPPQAITGASPRTTDRAESQGNGSGNAPGMGSAAASQEGGSGPQLGEPGPAKSAVPGSSAAQSPTAPIGTPPATSGSNPAGPGIASRPQGDPLFRPSKTGSEYATQGNQTDKVANGGPPPAAAPPVGGPSLAPGVTVGTNPKGAPQTNSPGTGASSGSQPTAPANAGGVGVPGGTSGNADPNGDKDNLPRFAPPQTNPPAKKPPQPLRIARLNGDRDYIVFIECRPDDVVLYPSRQTFSVQQLARGDQTLLQAVQKMIERRQALVRPGELPFRPQVRYLVHPESIRGYHTVYPVLNALGVPQTRQNLDADDDVTAIVVGQ